MIEPAAASRRACFLSFTIPGALVFGYDLVVLGRGYPLVSYDSITSMYGLALNWLALDPWPTPHHPAIFFQQLGALAAALTGTTAADLHGFAALTTALQFGFLLLAGWWFAREATRLELGTWPVVAIALITAGMPTLMITATHWGHYYPVGVLLAPLGLGLAGLFERADNRPADLWLNVGGLGFVTANFYVCGAIALPACLVALWCYARRSPAERLAWLGLDRPVDPRGRPLLALVAALMLTFAFCLPPLLYVLLGPSTIYEIDWGFMGPAVAASAGLALPAGALAWWIATRLTSWLPLLVQAVSPLLWGWLLGTNIMAGFWFLGALNALTARSGLADATAGVFDPWPFLLSHVWHWWLPVIAVLAVLALVAARGRPGVAPVGVFALGMIALNLLIGWSFVTDPSALARGAHGFGLTPRFLMAVLAAGPVLIAWAARHGGAWLARGTVLAAVALALGSAAQFGVAATEATAQAARVDRALGRVIDSFLAENPTGWVICANAEAPEACATLYAHHRYRKPGSFARLAPVNLAADRLQYRPRVTGSCWVSDAGDCWAPDGPGPGPILVIDGSGLAADGAVPGARLLWQGRRFDETYAAVRLDPATGPTP